MGTANSILIIDPHPARARFLRKTLGDGYAYVVAYALPSGMTSIEDGNPDLILLADDAAGAPLDSWLRQVAFAYVVPVIILSEHEWHSDDVTRILDAGAAYYLQRSDVLYLGAVVAQALRRVAWTRKGHEEKRVNRETIGDIVLTHDCRHVSVNGKSVRLTALEWSVFGHIVNGRGAPVNARDIAAAIYGLGPKSLRGEDPEVVYVRDCIHNLRLKLGYERIITEPFVGYRLAMEAS